MQLNFCLSCGVPITPSESSCLNCWAQVGIDPVEEVRSGDLYWLARRVDGVERTVLAIRRADSTYVTVDDEARVEVVAGSLGRESREVGGFEGCGSVLAAVLVSRNQLFGTAMQIEPWRAFAEWFSDGRLGTLRRAAMTLSAAGLSDLLRVLPLSITETAWWTAVALGRAGQSHQALAALQQLPADRYAAALSLQFELGMGTSVDERVRSERARSVAHELVTSRSPSAIAEAVSTWSPSVGAQPWLADRTQTPPPHSDGSMAMLYALARGAFPPSGHVLRIPSGAPLEVIDDLLDRDIRLDVSQISHGDVGTRVYVAARTAPETLTDDEVDSLQFGAERMRRLLLRGEVIEGDVPADAPAELASVVTFLRDRTVDATLAERLWPDGEQLARFLESPSLELLLDGFCDDTSLWPYLEERLPEDATEWMVPEGSARRRFLAWAVLRRATAALYDAQWSSAGDLARRVLLLSTEESIRDEALNVIACSCWQLGNDDGAVQALKSALGGQRNSALQVNLGVIAAQRDPEVAALELARLVREGATLELRSAAALRAVSLWLGDEREWESEAPEGMPVPLRDALRSIVKEPIDLETFRSIVALQARLDDTWLADARHTKTSPHAKSLEARLYIAKAAGAEALVDALVAAMKRQPVPDWVQAERDQLVKMVIAAAVKEPESSAALFGWDAMKKGLMLEPHERVLLVPLIIHAVCSGIDPTEGEPSDEFDTLLSSAEDEARQTGALGDLREIYGDSWNRLVGARLLYPNHQVDRSIDAYNGLLGQVKLIPQYRIDMNAVRTAFAPIVQFANEMEKALRRLPRHRVKSELVEFIDGLLEQVRDLRKHANDITR